MTKTKYQQPKTFYLEAFIKSSDTLMDADPDTFVMELLEKNGFEVVSLLAKQTHNKSNAVFKCSSI